MGIYFFQEWRRLKKNITSSRNCTCSNHVHSEITKNGSEYLSAGSSSPELCVFSCFFFLTCLIQFYNTWLITIFFCFGGHCVALLFLLLFLLKSDFTRMIICLEMLLSWAEKSLQKNLFSTIQYSSLFSGLTSSYFFCWCPQIYIVNST